MSKMENEKHLTDRELMEAIYYLQQNQSNRIAKMEKKIITGEADRKRYRVKREKVEEEKQGETIDKIKDVIRDQQFNLYVWVRDKLVYIGITLLIVWLSGFIK